MAFLLYRAIRNARKNKAAASFSSDEDNANITVRDAEVSGTVPASRNTASLQSRILLMIALLIPVFLETLDYTGMKVQYLMKIVFADKLHPVVATAQVHIAVSLILILHSMQSFISVLLRGFSVGIQRPQSSEVYRRL